MRPAASAVSLAQRTGTRSGSQPLLDGENCDPPWPAGRGDHPAEGRAVAPQCRQTMTGVRRNVDPVRNRGWLNAQCLRWRRKQLSAIFRLIVKARGPHDAPLFWPTIEVDEERRAHVDADPDAVKYLYHACKRVINAARRNQERGQVWLEAGIDPREDPNPWPANLAVLARACIEDGIVGASAVDKRVRSRLKSLTSAASDTFFAGVTLRDLYAAIAPNATRKLDSVVLRAIRPKTGP